MTGTKPRHRKYGPGGVQVIAAAHDRRWAEAEAAQPPCSTEDSESTDCRWAGHAMHVCSDSDGRTPPRTLCHAEARARLYDDHHNLAGAIAAEEER